MAVASRAYDQRADGVGLTLAQHLGDKGREALQRAKGKGLPVPATPPAGDYREDMRALAKVLAALQHDSPERQAMLKMAGVGEDSLSPRQCEALASSLLKVIDAEHAREDWAWANLPGAGRSAPPAVEGLEARRLSSVEARETEWLWDQRVVLGNLTMISGEPGIGKSWLVLDLLARITTGRDFPDSPNPFRGEGTCSARRDVLWVSAEDADEDTVKPRFTKLEGDPSRFHSITGVNVLGNGKLARRTLDLSQHIDHLERYLAHHPLIVAVAIDPITAFTGKVDTHKNSDVRGLLTPLREMAHRRGVAVVPINHLNKGEGTSGINRQSGSVAFVAAARASWMVVKDHNDEEEPRTRRLFTEVKGNYRDKDICGLAYRVGPTVPGGFLWEKYDGVMTADEALQAAHGDKGTGAPAKKEAKDILRELLKDGPVAAAEVWEQVQALRLCEKTVRVAAKELGVQQKKTGGKGAGWQWALPAK